MDSAITPLINGVVDPKFIEWINSINKNFASRTKYNRFEKYKKQSQEWLQDKLCNFESDSRDIIVDTMTRERDRIDRNSLYFFDRYIVIKDGDAADGFIRPDQRHSFEAQKILAYVFDSGLSFMLGKPRQIGSTAFLLPCGMKRTLVKEGYYVKFVCESDDKTQEIFADKLKFPFYQLPSWMQPEVANDRGNLLRFANRISKGRVTGLESKTQVIGPTRTAINGGSPNLVLIDEIGEIPILTEIMDEGRSALYFYDSLSGKWILKRQVCMWGTAGKTDDANSSYETIFKGILENFEKGDMGAGIIPLFFDLTSREGMDEKAYEEHKKAYIVNKSEAEKEKSLISFRQKYPRDLDDMFSKNYDTMIPYGQINEHIDRVRIAEKGQWGRFEPILDETRPMPPNFPVPFAIVGANWIPANDSELFTAPVYIRKHPVWGWKNRYYQGTDSIQGRSGHSKFASAVFDAYCNDIPAMLNIRWPEYKQCYVQSICLGLYFNTQELVEINTAEEYVSLLESFGLHHRLILSTQLLPYLQLGGNMVGINKRSANAEHITNKLSEFLTAYANKVEIEEVFNQLKTFVKKTTKTGFTWEPANRYSWDDELDAICYAYIARLCFPYLTPLGNDESEEKRLIKRYRYTQDWRLLLMTETEKRIVKKRR